MSVWLRSEKTIKELMLEARQNFDDRHQKEAKMIVVPHAGIEYSGLCAAAGYACFLGDDLAPRNDISLVVVLSTLHQNSQKNFSLHENFFEGLEISKMSKRFPKIPENSEHSFLTQTPFIRFCFPKAKILPIFVGDTQRISMNFEENFVIIANTDFSHTNSKISHRNLIKSERKTVESLLRMSPVFEKNHTICGWKVLQSLSFDKISHSRLVCHQTSKKESPLENFEGRGEKIVSYYSFAFYERDSDLIETKISRFEEILLLDFCREIVTRSKNSRVLIDCPNFHKKLGVFVATYNEKSGLRGSIGYIKPIKTILESVRDHAINSSENDSRFQKVQSSEFDDLYWKITLLGNEILLTDPMKWRIGKDGIILRNGNRQAIYVPSVATSQNWNRTQTFEHLAEKAGLNKSDWKSSQLFAIEGYEFF